MMTKLEIGALAAILVGVAAVMCWQQQQIKRLMVESAVLHDQLAQAASLRDENQRLAAQLKVSVDGSPVDQRELMRLRAQSPRLRQLEQENAQLKADRQAQQAAASAVQPLVTLAPDVKVTTVAPPMATTDLGMLEFADGVAARFDLGGGTNCVVTPTALPDGNVTMQIAMAVTNTDGTSSELGVARITARFGQHCSISVGDRMIALEIKPKPE
jgi:hypothetical protein